MKNIKLPVLCCSLLILSLTACSNTKDLNNQSNIDELLKLNSDLSRTMIVDKDKSKFDDVAVENFTVLAPGGLVESKKQVITGLSAWDVAAIEISNEKVTFHDTIATVTNRLDIDGTMQPIGRWGPLKSMRVFKYENGKWRLVSQSLTPCLPKAVEMGFC